MKNQIQIFKDYLTEKGINSWESNGELVTHCLLNNCDQDSKGKEAHFYMSLKTGQFHCKKCGESGNIKSILKDTRVISLIDALVDGELNIEEIALQLYYIGWEDRSNETS